MPFDRVLPIVFMLVSIMKQTTCHSCLLDEGLVYLLLYIGYFVADLFFVAINSLIRFVIDNLILSFIVFEMQDSRSEPVPRDGK